MNGGGIAKISEPAGQVGFFMWRHVPEPYTFYKGVRALPAGSTLWVDATGRMETKTYFNLSEELANASASSCSISPEHFHSRLRSALLESVRYHLIADVPVGVFLSAGLDSAPFTLLTKELCNENLPTVPLAFIDS